VQLIYHHTESGDYLKRSYFGLFFKIFNTTNKEILFFNNYNKELKLYISPNTGINMLMFIFHIIVFFPITYTSVLPICSNSIHTKITEL